MLYCALFVTSHNLFIVSGPVMNDVLHRWRHEHLRLLKTGYDICFQVSEQSKMSLWEDLLK